MTFTQDCYFSGCRSDTFTHSRGFLFNNLIYKIKQIIKFKNKSDKSCVFKSPPNAIAGFIPRSRASHGSARARALDVGGSRFTACPPHCSLLRGSAWAKQHCGSRLPLCMTKQTNSPLWGLGTMPGTEEMPGLRGLGADEESPCILNNQVLFS